MLLVSSAKRSRSSFRDNASLAASATAASRRHEAWVITRKAGAKGWTYTVPGEERGRLRQLTQEYRQYVRGRAVLVKRQAQILAMVDQLAEMRLEVWPPASKQAGGK